MDPLIKNFFALYEAIMADKECLPEYIFIKYGLMDITLDELKEIETIEMKRLHREEKLSLRKIGRMFSMTDSGVYRRIQAFDKKQQSGG
ncbi:MAG: helix-turn-helix domain-containing protein [Natronincolaceae bacterium]|nr:helix-turn-helix domain-containing protein [Bacillota bacterium]NLK91327.1 helix-turn-helix domain-containing protein [Clostridiales bacterium]